MNNSKCLVKTGRGEQGNLLSSVLRPSQESNPRENDPGLSARQTTDQHLRGGSASRITHSGKHPTMPWLLLTSALASRGNDAASHQPVGHTALDPVPGMGGCGDTQRAAAASWAFCASQKSGFDQHCPYLESSHVALDEEQGKKDGIALLSPKPSHPGLL